VTDAPRPPAQGAPGTDASPAAPAQAAPHGRAPQRWILMGDPAFFSVKGGANPHTRTRWGTRRRVDRQRAIAQWHRLRDTLVDLGLHVVVVPPDARQPGLVYPANAGVMADVDAPLPRTERRFLLANLLPSRAGEQAHYARVLAEQGIATETLSPALRFEGEADFFPAGGHYLFTHGRLERQRFVPALALPPWKRVYGFRSDLRAEALLAPRVAPKPVLRIELTLEAHYHGDTVLAAFGPGRRHLLGYRRGMTEESWALLSAAFGEHLIALDEADAQRYAANAFTYTKPAKDTSAGAPSESCLVMPAGVSERLLGQVRERGVTPDPGGRVRVPEEGRRLGEVHDRGPGGGGGGGSGGAGRAVRTFGIDGMARKRPDAALEDDVFERYLSSYPHLVIFLISLYIPLPWIRSPTPSPLERGLRRPSSPAGTRCAKPCGSRSSGSGSGALPRAS
jgi:N-dimethylarginine dimethylaminohydrolase